MCVLDTIKSFLRRKMNNMATRFEKHLAYAREEDNLRLGRLIYSPLCGNHSYGHLTIQHHGGNDVKVHVGNYCSIGPRVRVITGGGHPINRVSTYPFRIKFNLSDAYTDGFPSTKGDVVIGNDVWIASDVTILSGVHIGDGAVIMAGAIVSKDIPPYGIAGGIPARVVRKRMSDYHIEKMLEIKWWNWPEDKILSEVSMLSSDNIDDFINKHKT